MYSRKIDKCENKSLEYTKVGFNFYRVNISKLKVKTSTSFAWIDVGRVLDACDYCIYHQTSNPLRIIEYAAAEKMYHIGVGKLQ